MPGISSGSVILTNVRNGGEPRSAAASSSDQSSPRIRALTVNATNDRQNSVWAATIVQNPNCTPWLKNSVNVEAPNTISGVVSGRMSRKLITAPPFMR